MPHKTNVVSFTDIKLTPAEQRTLDNILNGEYVDSVHNALSRLNRKLLSAMPDVTWNLLLAQEFLRRQDAILHEQVLIRVNTAPIKPTDAEIDAAFCFYVKPLVKAATNA